MVGSGVLGDGEGVLGNWESRISSVSEDPIAGIFTTSS